MLAGRADSRAESTWRNCPRGDRRGSGGDDYMHEQAMEAFAVSELSWSPTS